MQRPSNRTMSAPTTQEPDRVTLRFKRIDDALKRSRSACGDVGYCSGRGPNNPRADCRLYGCPWRTLLRTAPNPTALTAASPRATRSASWLDTAGCPMQDGA